MTTSDKELPIAAQFNEVIANAQFNELQELGRAREAERAQAEALRKASNSSTLNISQAFLQEPEETRTRAKARVLSAIDALNAEAKKAADDQEKANQNARVGKFPAPSL